MNSSLRGGRYSPLPPISHRYAKQRLYVRKLDWQELRRFPSMIGGYVECTKLGNVNWDSPKFYHPEELIIRDNVFVVGDIGITA